MKDDWINIALAESFGWCGIIIPGDTRYMFLDDSEKKEANGQVVGRNITTHPDGSLHPIPDYCHDFNAIYEVEETLTDSEMQEYSTLLVGIVSHDAGSNTKNDYVFRASGSQRAEALLKTLGKWVEEKVPEDGKPCSYPKCLDNLWRPCAGCGRIGGITRSKVFMEYHKLLVRFLKTGWSMQEHGELIDKMDPLWRQMTEEETESMREVIKNALIAIP